MCVWHTIKRDWGAIEIRMDHLVLGAKGGREKIMAFH